MSFSAVDHRFMARAIRLAERGLFSTRPNPRVGCVIVRDGEVVGEGWHVRAGEPHAEVHALTQAAETARGADCYVTLEPCAHHGKTPPCVESLIAAGIRRVIAASEDPNPRVRGAGLAQLSAAGIDVACGLMAAETETLNCGFFQRMKRGRPWVRAKVGMTLDGRLATGRGESRWITSVSARRDVQYWRARSCAVMTGIGTILADDPHLSVRDLMLVQEKSPQPLRVILDSRLRTPSGAKVFSGNAEVLILVCEAVAGDVSPAPGGVVFRCPGEGGRVDLVAAMHELARRGINEVLLEAGPTLTGAMTKTGLVDELICYIAPKLLGESGLPMIRLGKLDALADARNLQIVDVRQLETDLRLILHPCGQ